MKKVFLAAVVALASLSANAQIWVGGSLGASAFKPEGNASNEYTITVAPEVGYTLNEDLDVALALNVDLSRVYGENAMGFAVEPYVRYTFFKADNFSIFAEGAVSYGTTKINPEDGTKMDDSVDTFKIGVRPGIKYAFNDNFSIVAKTGLIGYENVKDQYNKFNVNVNNSALQFGLFYAF